MPRPGVGLGSISPFWHSGVLVLIDMIACLLCLLASCISSPCRLIFLSSSHDAIKVSLLCLSLLLHIVTNLTAQCHFLLCIGTSLQCHLLLCLRHRAQLLLGDTGWPSHQALQCPKIDTLRHRLTGTDEHGHTPLLGLSAPRRHPCCRPGFPSPVGCYVGPYSHSRLWKAWFYPTASAYARETAVLRKRRRSPR